MSEVITYCNGCYFLSQYTCSLGRIELYCKNGGVYDEDAEQNPMIRGRFCNAKRDSEWYEKHENNYLEQLENETTVKYGVVINSYGATSLINAISFYEKQKFPPQAYYIIYNDDGFDNKIDLINEVLNQTNKIWKIKIPLEKQKSEFRYPNEYLITNTVKEPFILYIKDTVLPAQNLLEKINIALNKELKQVMAFRDFDYIFMSTQLAKTLKLDRALSSIIEAGHADKLCTI